MKKLVLILLAFAACDGKHLKWVSDKDMAAKEHKIEVVVQKLDTLGGVQFSFDDGPDLAKTPKVLDTLKQYNVRATFFVEGINLHGDSEQAKERRELLRRVVSEGHIIGNHTYD